MDGNENIAMIESLEAHDDNEILDYETDVDVEMAM